MLIKKCDICGKEESKILLRDISEVDDIIRVLFLKYNSGEEQYEGEVIDYLKRKIRKEARKGNISYICCQCICNLNERLREYYCAEAKKIMPELFPEDNVGEDL